MYVLMSECLKVSRAARKTTASKRIEFLAEPKQLSRDYIPPREPEWSHKDLQSTSGSVSATTKVSVCSFFVKFSKLLQVFILFNDAYVRVFKVK